MIVNAFLRGWELCCRIFEGFDKVFVGFFKIFPD